MDDRSSQLIDAYLDSILSPGDLAEFQEILRNDGEAREQLRLRALVMDQLTERAVEFSEEEGLAEKVAAFPRWKAVLPWAVAALFAVGFFIDRLGEFGSGEEGDTELTALLVSQADAVFEEGFSPDEVRFGPGEYRLSGGAAHLRFSNGTDLVMKAPAEFRIADAFRVELERGGLRAIVPPSGQGFTIESPGVDYEDLGTEFGVSVDESTGRSELHVFDGQVDVKPEEDRGKILSSVYRGESRQFDGGELSPIDAPDEDEFPTPATISFLRWERWSRAVVGDPSLVAFFPFQRSGDEESRLENVSRRADIGDATISGARWVSGRWPGKGALLFDRESDFAEFTIPGEVDEMTVSIWLNAAGFDREITAILDSNGWDAGDVHWQVNRLGFPWVGLKGNVPRRKFVGDPMAPGQWSHLVMALSKEHGVVDVYVNGDLSMTGEISPDVTTIPGVCRLGNWLRDPEWPDEPVRAFRGRIDELAIWNRFLPKEEIQEVFEAGRPSLLWHFKNPNLTSSSH